MRRRALLLTTAAVLLAPVPASAVTLLTPDGHIAQPWQQWADASRAPVVAGTITLDVSLAHTKAACPPDSAACTAPGAAPATIYLDPTASRTRWQRRRTLMHELGHHFDHDTLTGPERAAFQRLDGDTGAWGDGANERFAEAYAFCAIPARMAREWMGFDVVYGYAPTRGQHRQACALIRRAGGWFMDPPARPRTRPRSG